MGQKLNLGMTSNTVSAEYFKQGKTVYLKFKDTSLKKQCTYMVFQIDILSNNNIS